MDITILNKNRLLKAGWCVSTKLISLDNKFTKDISFKFYIMGFHYLIIRLKHSLTASTLVFKYSVTKLTVLCVVN